MSRPTIWRPWGIAQSAAGAQGLVLAFAWRLRLPVAAAVRNAAEVGVPTISAVALRVVPLALATVIVLRGDWPQ